MTDYRLDVQFYSDRDSDHISPPSLTGEGSVLDQLLSRIHFQAGGFVNRTKRVDQYYDRWLYYGTMMGIPPVAGRVLEKLTNEARVSELRLDDFIKEHNLHGVTFRLGTY